MCVRVCGGGRRWLKLGHTNVIWPERENFCMCVAVRSWRFTLCVDMRTFEFELQPRWQMCWSIKLSGLSLSLPLPPVSLPSASISLRLPLPSHSSISPLRLFNQDLFVPLSSHCVHLPWLSSCFTPLLCFQTSYVLTAVVRWCTGRHLKDAPVQLLPLLCRNTQQWTQNKNK